MPGAAKAVNLRALAIMVGVLTGWLALLIGAFYLGNPALLATFAVLTVAMFVPWDVRR